MSAFCAWPQATHWKLACERRESTSTVPHALQVCEVYAGFTAITFFALYVSMEHRDPHPVARIPRFNPAFAFTFLPGLSTVPFALAVMPLVCSASTATVLPLRTILRLTWCCQSRRAIFTLRAARETFRRALALRPLPFFFRLNARL